MKHLFSLLNESSLKYRDKVYVVDHGRCWTYGQVADKVCAWAGFMRKYGIHSGDRILVYLDNSVDYIVAFFSILLANGIVVPINKNTSPENIQYIIQDTSPQMLLSNDIFLSRIADKVDFGGCCTVNVEKICGGRQCEEDEAGGGHKGEAGGGARSEAGGGLKGEADSGHKGEAGNGLREDTVSRLTDDAELPAVILYTSGTTKMPKGVTLTHKNLLTNTSSINEYLGLTQEDSILATINFCYSYGNSILLTHTKAGGTLVIENRVSYPLKIIEQLHESQVTGFSTVGSYINLLLKQEGLRDFHLQYLRYITFAGESTNFDDIVKLNKLAPHIAIFVMYGQTEASARLSYLDPAQLFAKAGSIGKGIPGVKLRVVNEDGREVVPAAVGEIIASGDNIMMGYWNNEAETKAAIRGGWLHTGDLATVDEEGFIYVKGRNDDMIKYLGHRISPLEIESVINSCDLVLESAVIGIETESGKQIKAYIVPRYEEYDTHEIAVNIKRQLPPFKNPRFLEFVWELPRTANGKIKRSELRAINVQASG